VRLGVGDRKRAAPGAAKDNPAFHAQVLSQGFKIGDEMRRLMADPVEIDRILAEGAGRAHAIADPILGKTKDIVGLIRS